MLTIGEFSHLGHVSARMLRHYDMLGLLRPAHVGGENGYRYYDARQLTVLAKIETLKSYGFSLHEIGGMLDLSEAELAKRIHFNRLKAYEALHKMRKNLRRMEEDIIKMEGTSMSLEQYRVAVMEQGAQKVFGIRRTINVSQIHELFQELAAEMARLGLKRTGATQMLYHGEEFDYAKMDVEAQAAVSQDGPGVRTLPACTCAAVIHTGPYETVKYAYDALSAWMARHPEYQVCGPAVERYLRDEETASSPEELETGVLFPVKKIAG